MDVLLNSGTLRLSLTFNPAHAQQKVASGELPKSSYSFGFSQGMLGNVHFVAIPANARAVPQQKSWQTSCFRPKHNCVKPTQLSGEILRCLIHKNYLSNSVMRCWHGSHKDSLPFCRNRMLPG